MKLTYADYATLQQLTYAITYKVKHRCSAISLFIVALLPSQTMFLAVILLAVVGVVLYVKWAQTYWQRKGVPTGDFDFFFGHIKNVITKKQSLGESMLRYYKEMKKLNAKHAGRYFFLSSSYIPLDPMIVKQIMLKDFNHFNTRGTYHHPNDVLTMNLFNLDGNAKWKDLRAKLTPTFTSGKMKVMFETLADKTKGLEKLVQQYSVSHKPFAIKEVSEKFTTDIIGSCAFGLECNSLEEDTNEFSMYGKKSIKPNILHHIASVILPWSLLGFLDINSIQNDVTEFFSKVVKDTIRYRESNVVTKKDFMDLLLKIKNEQGLSENDIIAQCFIFFLGGFETSSTTMTFAMLELAQNQDIQEKLRKEIKKVLTKHEGKISYEAVMEMRYLEQVINGTYSSPKTFLNNLTIFRLQRL